MTWAPWQLPIVEHPEEPRPNEPLVLIHVEHAGGRQSMFTTRRRCDTGVHTASLIGKHVVIELGDGVDWVRLLAVGTGEAPPRVRVLRVATAQGRTFCTRGAHTAADDAAAAALRPLEELIRERAGVNCIELRLDGKHMVVTGWRSKKAVDRAARAVLRRSVKIFWV